MYCIWRYALYMVLCIVYGAMFVYGATYCIWRYVLYMVLLIVYGAVFCIWCYVLFRVLCILYGAMYSPNVFVTIERKLDAPATHISMFA